MNDESQIGINLAGKRVLLIAPRFFGYESEVANEIARRGAEVDFIRDRPFEQPIMKVITRSQRRLMMPAANRFYRRELARFGRRTYDTILVINGQTLSPTILREMRSAFPAATFILYMWDSVELRSSVVDNLDFFDRTMSFDRKSANRFGMIFRPLFYSPGFDISNDAAHDIAVSFIGTMHSDRYSVISSIARKLPAELPAYWYLYLQAPWVYHVQKFTNPAFRDARLSEFSFEPLPRKCVLDVFRRSKAIIDIEHPLQTGLTMRTLEAFGSRKKLLTTNRSISEYDLFDQQNICILDRRNAVAPLNFFELPYQTPSEQLRYKYSLAGWVDSVLGVQRTDDIPES